MIDSNTDPTPRKSALRALPIVCLILVCVSCSRTETTDEPGPRAKQPGLDLTPVTEASVVIVTYDALRADALGLYGYDLLTSPHLDRFAQEALVFERAYTAAPVTPTSFAAALTGKLPHRVFRGWQFTEEMTLPGAFSEAGYSTAAFFNNTQLTEERGFGRGFDTYHAYKSVTDDQVLRDALDWLEEHHEGRFFLWIHFLSPHSPYEHREISQHLYDPAYEGTYQTTTKGSFETDDAREIARIRSLYDGEVFFADHLFGRLHRALEALGVFERAIVVVSSDHGEEFKERGGFQHEKLHEETIRVPLLLRLPGGQGRGTRIDLTYSHVDLFPTLGGLAGVPVEGPIDGANLLEPLPPERAIVSEAMTSAEYRGVGVLRGLTKLILNCRPAVEVELYDLGEDPAERTDREGRSPEIRRELITLLRGIYQGDPCSRLDDAVRGVQPTEGLDEDTIRELKALGYLQ